jgi:hypothetical protein
MRPRRPCARGDPAPHALGGVLADRAAENRAQLPLFGVILNRRLKRLAVGLPLRYSASYSGL